MSVHLLACNLSSMRTLYIIVFVTLCDLAVALSSAAGRDAGLSNEIPFRTFGRSGVPSLESGSLEVSLAARESRIEADKTARKVRSDLSMAAGAPPTVALALILQKTIPDLARYIWSGCKSCFDTAIVQPTQTPAAVDGSEAPVVVTATVAQSRQGVSFLELNSSRRLRRRQNFDERTSIAAAEKYDSLFHLLMKSASNCNS